MNQLEQFIQIARAYGYLLLAASNVLLIVIGWLIIDVFNQTFDVMFATLSILALLLPILTIWLVSNLFLRPLRFVWQSILYISPDVQAVAAPDTTKLTYAKELVDNLVRRVYQLAEAGQQFSSKPAAQESPINPYFVLENMPLPIVVLDSDRSIMFANHTFAEYIGRKPGDTIGENVYSLMDLSFMSDLTLDMWLDSVKDSRPVATNYWERVKLRVTEDDKAISKLLDLAAYYNKDNPEGVESVLVLFDHSKTYGRDDEAIDFVALAVHELRTPLTMLRGYIEVLEEETAGKLTPELESFIARMQASAQQLATFVNNVLNVARADEDQLVLKLQEADWSKFLDQSIKDLSLRAKVRGITLKAAIDPKLPTVGADKISMYQVLSNLVDNAIKYSPTGSEIVITSTLGKNGMIETTVQDSGKGIPESAVPNLFEKFYRDHHNRKEVGGTGMGLYLVKTLVQAHDGNVWVRSKEGQGSTFGFTLKPYAELADEQKNTDTNGIVRNAHGWIKNHSMYRR